MSNVTIYTPLVGFTELSKNNDGSCQVVWFGREVDGTESGDITFTSDIAQRHSAVAAIYRDVLLPFNDIDYVLEAAVATDPMSHTAPTVHPTVIDAVVLTSYAERTGVGNSEGTITGPAGYTMREEVANAGSGGVFINLFDDGGTTPRAADIDVTPSNWSCPIGSGTALMTSIALARG